VTLGVVLDGRRRLRAQLEIGSTTSWPFSSTLDLWIEVRLHCEVLLPPRPFRDSTDTLARLGAAKSTVAPSKLSCSRGGERLHSGDEIYLSRALTRFEILGGKTSQASRPALRPSACKATTSNGMGACHAAGHQGVSPNAELKRTPASNHTGRARLFHPTQGYSSSLSGSHVGRPARCGRIAES
jgi:hypothetical protein